LMLRILLRPGLKRFDPSGIFALTSIGASRLGFVWRHGLFFFRIRQFFPVPTGRVEIIVKHHLFHFGSSSG
jgi:hypothetical protein